MSTDEIIVLCFTRYRNEFEYIEENKKNMMMYHLVGINRRWLLIQTIIKRAYIFYGVCWTTIQSWYFFFFEIIEMNFIEGKRKRDRWGCEIESNLMDKCQIGKIFVCIFRIRHRAYYAAIDSIIHGNSLKWIDFIVGDMTNGIVCMNVRVCMWRETKLRAVFLWHLKIIFNILFPSTCLRMEKGTFFAQTKKHCASIHSWLNHKEGDSLVAKTTGISVSEFTSKQSMFLFECASKNCVCIIFRIFYSGRGLKMAWMVFVAPSQLHWRNQRARERKTNGINKLLCHVCIHFSQNKI